MNTSLPINIFSKSYSVKVGNLLLILVFVAAFIRFHRLTYVSLWLDEIYSMIGSDPNTTLSDVYIYSKNDQPPLFFFLLHGWLKLFGYTDFAGRAITCTYGVLGVVAMFFLGKEVKNEKLGLFASFVTTINWYHVDISKELRFYPLVFLLTTLSYLFYLRAIKKSRISDFILYTLFTALLLNTHYYGMVVFVSQFIIFLLVVIFFKRNLRLFFGSIIAGALAGLSFWHWLPVIQHDLQINVFHVDAVDMFFVFDYFWDYVKDPVALALFTFCIFLTVKATYQRILEKKILVDHIVIFGWIFFGVMIPFVYSALRMPLLTSKYCTIIVPALFLVISNGFTHFTNERVRSYCMIAIVISGAIILFHAHPPYKPRRSEDWREVAMNFTHHQSDKQVIFSQLAWFHQYYFKKHNLELPIDQNLCDFANIVSSKDQVWLFMNNRYTGGWPVVGLLPEQKEIINREFEPKDSITFEQTKALLYNRKK